MAKKYLSNEELDAGGWKTLRPRNNEKEREEMLRVVLGSAGMNIKRNDNGRKK